MAGLTAIRNFKWCHYLFEIIYLGKTMVQKMQSNFISNLITSPDSNFDNVLFCLVGIWFWEFGGFLVWFGLVWFFLVVDYYLLLKSGVFFSFQTALNNRGTDGGYCGEILSPWIWGSSVGGGSTSVDSADKYTYIRMSLEIIWKDR